MFYVVLLFPGRNLKTFRRFLDPHFWGKIYEIMASWKPSVHQIRQSDYGKDCFVKYSMDWLRPTSWSVSVILRTKNIWRIGWTKDGSTGVVRVTSHPPCFHFELTHKKNMRSKLTFFGDQTILIKIVTSFPPLTKVTSLWKIQDPPLLNYKVPLQGGMYVFNLMDYQTAGVSLLFLALMEIVTVGWIYGGFHMIGLLDVDLGFGE